MIYNVFTSFSSYFSLPTVRYPPDTEIVSRRCEDNRIHRTTWAQIAVRARQVSSALDSANMAPGTRVATLAWNSYRHIELYYGVSGSGRIVHTLNPRLHEDQLVWIANHAQDSVFCFDMTFIALVKKIHARIPSVKLWVLLCDTARFPANAGIPGLVCYETWLNNHSPRADSFPRFDDNSGTTRATVATSTLPLPFFILRYCRQPSAITSTMCVDGSIAPRSVNTVLHIWHDRLSQGCALQPSVHGSTRVCPGSARLFVPRSQRHDCT
jgi:acyl-CoA synthetase (AMP-forming)/AMP-acid ligase II